MPIEKEGKLMLTLADLKVIVQRDGIFDGTLGGLILGNSHSDGGIKVIRQYKNEELYEVFAELEGYEYLLNPFITTKEMEYLKKLNMEFDNTNEKFVEYDIPIGIGIIDTKSNLDNIKETNKYILLDERAQWIINKHSTKKYLIELDNLNKKHCR